MHTRTLLTAVGAGVAAFLLAAVAVIELLDFEFSAIVGLPVGVLAGVAVVVLVLSRFHAVAPSVQLGVTGLAGFGYGILLALAANYVHLLDTGFEVTVGIAVAAAVIAVLDRARSANC